MREIGTLSWKEQDNVKKKKDNGMKKKLLLQAFCTAYMYFCIRITPQCELWNPTLFQSISKYSNCQWNIFCESHCFYLFFFSNTIIFESFFWDKFFQHCALSNLFFLSLESNIIFDENYSEYSSCKGYFAFSPWGSHFKTTSRRVVLKWLPHGNNNRIQVRILYLNSIVRSIKFLVSKWEKPLTQSYAGNQFYENFLLLFLREHNRKGQLWYSDCIASLKPYGEHLLEEAG